MSRFAVLALACVFIFSCSHFRSQPADVLFEMAQEHRLTHFQSHCLITDLLGNVVYKFNGYLCVFKPDGELIAGAFSADLTKYDSQLRVIWQRPWELNHQLKPSQFGPYYLTIRNNYVNENKKLIRHDELLVFDEDGKEIKSFSFKPYVESLREKPRLNKLTSRRKNVYEYTHINSIAETYIETDGKKELSGYVTYDKNSKQIFFLDKDMRSITAVAETGKRSLHDIAPISATEYIFYLNEIEPPSKNQNDLQFSKIEIFNSKTGNFRLLYENNKEVLISKICSSVQYLSAGKLIVFHSACPALSNPPEKRSHIEAVDLSRGESFILPVDAFKESIEAKLINAEAFLKKTNGK